MQSYTGQRLISDSKTRPLRYVRITSKRSNYYKIKIKPVIDLICSTLFILIFSPIMILIAFGIKFSSKGPLFYKQKRVGHRGKIFTLYKFRTMRENCNDEVHREYIAKLINGEINSDRQSKNQKAVYKLNSDARVTKIGKFLRIWSLDELPQFFNVLKGEMSLVGPRPPIPYEVEEYSAWQLQRLDALPGITGLWQVNGRSRTNFDDMVRLDIQYIRNSSFSQDMKIFLKTFKAIISRDGAL